MEGTTGNTGISTCMVGAVGVSGYHSYAGRHERGTQENHRRYGAELVLTSERKQMWIWLLEEVARLKKNTEIDLEVGQFVRPENVDAHYLTTDRKYGNKPAVR